MPFRRTSFALLLCAAPLLAADPPRAAISNGILDVELYLPDKENGYYRATRFDWSGAIFSLTYEGHQFFGEWQQSDDPYLHDRITGPVEQFTDGANHGVGYADAASGEAFLCVGVGICVKPSPADEKRFKTYEVSNYGEWSTEQGDNWIRMTHKLSDAASGYGYVYTKTLTLPPGRNELVIDHALQNVGDKRLKTSVYNHNFFVIDGRPTGPEFTVRFPFELTAVDNRLRDYASVRGNELRYAKELPEGQSIITLLEGFGPTAEDHSFVIENSEAGVGVRMTADRPMSMLRYWSPRTTLCPEPFIDLDVAAGQADRWSLRYEFYETAEGRKRD